MPIRKSGGKWQTRRQICHVFSTKSEALQFNKTLDSAIAEARRRHREKVTPCCSIGDKLGEFISDSKAGLGRRPRGDKTRVRHRRRLEMFDRTFQRKPIDAISRDRLERWIKRRLDQVSVDTVKADLIALYAFARWARDKGFAPQHLPLLTVDRLHSKGKLAGLNRLPPKAMEMGEMKRIIKKIKKARPDMGLFLEGMARFGRRPAAVAMAKREGVRLPLGCDQGGVWFKGLKGGCDQKLPAPAGSHRAKWLRECLALGKKLGRDRPRDPLVPCAAARAGSRSRRRGGWTTESFDMALARIVKKLRINATPYVIRHTCMTFLQRQPESSLASNKEYASHRRIDTQNAYSHINNTEAEIAYQLIEEALGAL